MSQLKEKQKFKAVQLHDQNPKQFSKPTQPQKLPSKLSQIQIPEFRKSQKMKVVQLHKLTPRLFLNPTSNPKISHQGPKSKKDPKIKSKSNVRIEEKKIKILHYMSRPRNNLNLIPTLKIAYFGQNIGPLNQMKLKARIEGDIENIYCFAI